MIDLSWALFFENERPEKILFFFPEGDLFSFGRDDGHKHLQREQQHLCGDEREEQLERSSQLGKQREGQHRTSDEPRRKRNRVEPHAANEARQERVERARAPSR